MKTVVSILVFVLLGCTTPTQKISDTAKNLGFLPFELSTAKFRLYSFYKPPAREHRVLHVYLEGDGKPWASPIRIAEDPTPRNPVMLRLMALDESPAIYLGRPCYFDHANDPGCQPVLWTHRRYAPEILESLADGLRQFLSIHPYPRLIFLGHSGGGVLALLLAERFPESVAVVCLATNVDILAWTTLHGYTPLRGSLNPTEQASLPFREYFFFGEDDTNVPSTVFAPIAKKRSQATVKIIRGADHQCCWERVWSDILRPLTVYEKP